VSAYHEYETDFRNADCLCKALRECGLDPDVHEQAVQLRGYHNDLRQETAEIVVPRLQLGSAANDLGFKQQPDGTYKMILSEYDQQATFPKRRQAELKRKYGERWAHKLAARHGARLIGRREVGGKVQLVFGR
jgi:hypothetical protein